MKTTNKKAIKEIKTLITASEKLKQLALQELESIDAKYKAMADAEKTELSKMQQYLETRIKEYQQMLTEEVDTNEPEQETKEEQPVKESSESEKITDTIFEENNHEEPVEDNAPVPSAPEEKDTNEQEDLPADSAVDEKVIEESVEEQKESDEDWPDIPEEWN